MLQRQACCTVHDGHGGRCGTRDQCTTVVTVDRAGCILHRHAVCGRCRERMNLPEHDVTLGPDGTESRRFTAL